MDEKVSNKVSLLLVIGIYALLLGYSSSTREYISYTGSHYIQIHAFPPVWRNITVFVFVMRLINFYY